MKKNYTKPEIEVKEFATDDVMYTSGLYEVGTGEGEVQNIKSVSYAEVFNLQ